MDKVWLISYFFSNFIFVFIRFLSVNNVLNLSTHIVFRYLFPLVITFCWRPRPKSSGITTVCVAVQSHQCMADVTLW